MKFVTTKFVLLALFLLIITSTINIIMIEAYKSTKKELVSSQLDIQELKRDRGVLAAGIMELRNTNERNDAYVSSIINGLDKQ